MLDEIVGEEVLLGNRISGSYCLQLLTWYVLVWILINQLWIINVISTAELFLIWWKLIWISHKNLFILKYGWIWIKSLEFLDTKWFLFSTFYLIRLDEGFFSL